MTATTLLLRQIHPSFVFDGRASSQAFRPTPKDRLLLSVYDGDRMTPAGAWGHFTAAGHSSAGVMAVSVGECAAESLPARPDPEPFPEHAVIDFTGLNGNQVKKKGNRLQELAEARGWLYQPPTDN